ncbi:MAG: ABC transporter substrate-binding protein, partial [Bacteroidota bacterium]
EAQNAIYLEKLREVDTLTIDAFPAELIDLAREAAGDVIADFAASDPFATRVYASIQEFQRRATPWGEMTEKTYYQAL